MEKKRRISQYLFALLGNSYWFFPWKGPIYQGSLKRLCFVGLNCYSCPAAVGSCPIGALQNFLAGLRFNLLAGNFLFGFYVLGFLGMIGALIGRLPCGWMCPFGLIQEWLYKIPTPKISLWRPLRWGPHIMLLLFVIVLPLTVTDQVGFGYTWYCKYICPAGTLEAGIPLLALQPELRSLLGMLFSWKLMIMLFVVLWSIFSSRPFCRTLCPLGAIYGLMNRFSVMRLRFEQDACVQCKACYTICPTGVSFYDGRDDINSSACIRCLRCSHICPAGGVSVEFSLKVAQRQNKGVV